VHLLVIALARTGAFERATVTAGWAAAKPFMTLSEYIVFLQNSDLNFLSDPGNLYVPFNHGAYRACDTERQWQVGGFGTLRRASRNTSRRVNTHLVTVDIQRLEEL
jgi:hypothetical protein